MAGFTFRNTQAAEIFGDLAQHRDYSLNVLLGCLQSRIFCVGHNNLFLAGIQELFFF
jgi:hypothetical protein